MSTTKSDASVTIYDRDHNPTGVVTVDADNIGLSSYMWIKEKEDKTVYRSLTMKTDGRVGKEYLHRRVMALDIGCGKMVKFKTPNRLDCRRANLYIDTNRKVMVYTTLPKNPREFMKYLDANHSGTQYENIASLLTISYYSKKSVVFEIEGGETNLSPSVVTTLFDEFFKTEFNYQGKVSVVINRSPDVILESKPLKPVVPEKHPAQIIAPIEPSADKVVPTTQAGASVMVLPVAAASGDSGDAVAFVQRLVAEVFGTKEVSLDFCSFGIRQQGDLLKFSFEREKDAGSVLKKAVVTGLELQ